MNRRFLKKYLFVAILPILILSGVGYGGVQEKESKKRPIQTKTITEIQKENQMLRAEVVRLRAENQKLRSKLVEGGNSTVQTNQQAKKVSEPEYRLSTSGIRHNKTCRYFNCKGRPCGKNEGRPCRKCGG